MLLTERMLPGLGRSQQKPVLDIVRAAFSLPRVSCSRTHLQDVQHTIHQRLAYTGHFFWRPVFNAAIRFDRTDERRNLHFGKSRSIESQL